MHESADAGIISEMQRAFCEALKDLQGVWENNHVVKYDIQTLNWV